jgi:hypothetical protein
LIDHLKVKKKADYLYIRNRYEKDAIAGGHYHPVIISWHCCKAPL